MKVAILCGYVLPKGYSAAGSTTYQVKLTHYLSRRKNIELHIITIGEENSQFKSDNLIIHTIKKRKIITIPFFHPLLLWRIKQKTMKINPDIVHAFSSGLLYSTVSAFLRDIYPTVLTTYGIVAKEIKYYRQDYKTIQKILSYISSSISIINQRYVTSRIPNIIVEAPSIKDLISKWTKSKIYIAPGGVEYKEIEEKQPLILSEESIDIFMMVNLEKIKGVDVLIKAIPSALNSIPNLNVCIAGSGPQESELKSLVKRLNLEDHVKFLGFVSEEKKYQYYKACKLVVVPSRWDCQPAALFDAAASGKPVIASDMSNPGIVEDGKTGHIFKSENVEDLADKIIILLKDEKIREEMGRAAKEKVKQYDWGKVAGRYIEIYKEAIADFHERKAKSKKRRIS